jgi:hypothetical protein
LRHLRSIRELDATDKRSMTAYRELCLSDFGSNDEQFVSHPPPRACASLCRRVRPRGAVSAGPHCIHALAILAMTSNRVNV